MTRTKSKRLFTSDELNEMIGKRYRLGIPAGEGECGQIFEAEDMGHTDSIGHFGRRVAIKFINPTEEQMKKLGQRKITLEDVAMSEDIGLHALQNTVPRYLEKGPKSDQFFLLMPTFRYSLAEVLDRLPKKRYSRRYGGSNLPESERLSFSQVANWSRDIANAIYESHYILERLHGDIKPGNFMVDPGQKQDIRNGRLLLTDFGNSKFGDLGYTIGPDDNKSADYTKPPECFILGDKATRQSDVWSGAAIIYRMLTGEYPFQPEIDEIMSQDIDHQKALRELFDDLHKDGNGERLIQRRIRKKVTHINQVSDWLGLAPFYDSLYMSPLKKFLSRNLSFDENRRSKDGAEFRENLEEALRAVNLRDNMKKQFYGTLGFSAPVLAVGICLALTTFNVPQEITMPNVRVMPSIEQIDPSKILQFQYEMLGIHKVPQMQRESSTGFIYHATNNAYTAFLARAYFQSRMDLRDVFDMNKFPLTTPAMEDLYANYRLRYPEKDDSSDPAKAPVEERRVVKAIESAIPLALDPITGNIDLDDLLSILIVGYNETIANKKFAKEYLDGDSEKFATYRNARNIGFNGDGSSRYAPMQLRLIDQWKSYFVEAYEEVNCEQGREK